MLDLLEGAEGFSHLPLQRNHPEVGQGADSKDSPHADDVEVDVDVILEKEKAAIACSDGCFVREQVGERASRRSERVN